MYGWGVMVRGNGLALESQCWRCQEQTVPNETSSTNCDACMADLQDSPRNFRSRSSSSTTARD